MRRVQSERLAERKVGIKLGEVESEVESGTEGKKKPRGTISQRRGKVEKLMRAVKE